ncbi:MAG: LTA synthase family protein, partial [Gammaproteobacteria bacterium]
ASYGVAPVVALTLISFFRPLGQWPARIRRVWAVTLTALCVLIFIVDVGYFHAYHDQFNHWIFGLLFDDRTAIAQTIWKSYPVFLLMFMAATLIAGLIWAGRIAGHTALRRFPLSPAFASSWRQWATPVVVVSLLITGMRASFDNRPVQVTAAATTNDVFLNKLVLNPFAALKRAIRNHQTLAHSKGLAAILPGGDIRAAARDWFPKVTDVTNLDEHLKRIAPGSPSVPPRHIFIIVEESYDTWGMQPENLGLHVNDRLIALGHAGFAADAFLSGGDHTIASLSALISGTLDTGVNVNYQPLPTRGLPMAPAAIFKQLGYRTRFFYPGYLSWQRIGEFCREQGFDEVHSGVEIASDQPHNEWGVPDEELFDFALGMPSDQPTFNIIMTISYHAPFSVDIDAKGFPRQALAKEFAARGYNEEQTRVLGHLWYADKALGDFVATAENRFPLALFAITGDHWSRREFNKRQTLLVQRAVPFILYGPEVLRDVPRPQHFIGSHLDVIPTLIELSAPRGFEYYSFGHNMLDPAAPPIGYGSNAVVTPDLVLDVSSQNQIQDHHGQPLTNNARTDELRLRYQQLSALNWWRVMKGPNL